MKLINKLVAWFEDLLWTHAVKEGTKIRKKYNCDARLDGDKDA